MNECDVYPLCLFVCIIYGLFFSKQKTDLFIEIIDYAEALLNLKA